MSNNSDNQPPNGDGADPNMERSFETLDKAPPDPPRLPAQQNQENIAVAAAAEAFLDADVHSYKSLSFSREHCIRLIGLLTGEYARTHVILELINQEKSLQESIRGRTYLNEEIFARTQVWLVKRLGIGCFIIALVAMGYAFYYHSDSRIFGVMLNFSKWIFGGCLVTILSYYFKSKFTK